MTVLWFSHYNLRLNAALMEQVRAFYCDVIGLRVGPPPAFRSRGYWLYAGESAILHLSEEKPEDPRQAGSHLTFDHVAFECTDWPSMEASLRVHGVEFHEDRVPGTGVRQVFFRDPAGNGVELAFRIEPS